MKIQESRQRRHFGTWSNRRSLAALEWVLVLNNPKLLYVETPKAACTKIRTLLILLNRGYEDTELVEFMKNTKPAPYYHWKFGIRDNHNITSEKLFTLFDSPDYFKFTFVRNPYDRLVSAYINRICEAPLKGHQHYTHISKKIKAETSWNQSGLIAHQLSKINQKINGILPKRRPSSYLARTKFLENSATNTFDDINNYNYNEILQLINETFGKQFPPNIYELFLEKLKLIMGYPNFDDIDLDKTPVSFEEFIRFIHQQDFINMEKHWQPQTFYIGYGSANYDFIGRVENFNRDIEYVFTKIAAPEYIYRHIEGKMNASPKTGQRSFWTDELAEMVYQKYKDDFEAFGYHKGSYKS